MLSLSARCDFGGVSLGKLPTSPRKILQLLYWRQIIEIARGCINSSIYVICHLQRFYRMNYVINH